MEEASQDLSDYEIIQELASGASSRFLEARHRGTEKLCVLKRIIQGASNPRKAQRVKEEVSLLKKFHEFPGIVRTVGNFNQKDDSYVVLEHEEGWKSVRNIANTNANTRPDKLAVLSSSDLSVFTVEMIRVLEMLHSHNPPIIHRDIKPENVFCVYNFDMPKYRGFKYKLSDFGSAVTQSESMQPFSSGYNRSYMAPEVAVFLDGETSENGAITTKTDMWNFGASLLDLAVNSDVFDPSISSGAAIRAKIRNGTFNLKEDILLRLPAEGRKRWDNLNPFIQEVIIQCLHVRASERPSATAIRNSAPYKVAKHLCRSFYEEMILLKTQLPSRASNPDLAISDADEMRTYSTRFNPEDMRAIQSKECMVAAEISNDYIDQLFTRSICGKADAYFELLQLAEARSSDHRLTHPLATGLLMCLYATGGNSVPKDVAKAEGLSHDVLHWLRHVAEHTTTEGEQQESIEKYTEYIWSICYHRGLGVSRDHAMVMEHLQRSADAGYIPAINNLGILKYSNPHASAEDLMKAFTMFTQCSLAEYPPGYYSMGLVYEERRVFPHFSAHREMSFQYYLVAAKQGYLPAMTEVALGFYHGYDKGQVNYEQAVFYFKNSAIHGDAKAQYYLGLCSELGYGVAIDLAEAYRWYEASAAQNNMDAQFRLGASLMEGRGVTKNITEGAKWLHLSAQKGSVEARNALAHYKL